MLGGLNTELSPNHNCVLAIASSLGFHISLPPLHPHQMQPFSSLLCCSFSSSPKITSSNPVSFVLIL